MISIPNKNPLAVLEDEKLKHIKKLQAVLLGPEEGAGVVCSVPGDWPIIYLFLWKD